jgi:hypothetical protein
LAAFDVTPEAISFRRFPGQNLVNFPQYEYGAATIELRAIAIPVIRMRLQVAPTAKSISFVGAGCPILESRVGFHGCRLRGVSFTLQNRQKPGDEKDISKKAKAPRVTRGLKR